MLHWIAIQLFFAVFGSPQYQPADLSAEQVRSELLQSCSRIESIRVCYRGSSLIRNRRNYILREIAAKRPCLYYHHGAHGGDDVNWKDDPYQQKAWILADRLFNEHPLQRAYLHSSWDARSPLPGTLQTELWHLITGCWPLEMREPPRLWNMVPMLHVVAVSADYSLVSKDLEQVDGHWCHVLEHPGIDKLWLDIQRGCCLVRREVTDPKTGELYGRVELTEQSEAAPGVWLPRHTRHRVWTRQSKDTNPDVDYVIEVLELSANDIPDGQFTFTARPGSISYPAGDANAAQQTEPGGVDHLDELVDWMRRVYGPPRPVESRIFESVLPYAVVLLTLALLSALEIRRRSGRIRARQFPSSRSSFGDAHPTP